MSIADEAIAEAAASYMGMVPMTTEEARQLQWSDDAADIRSALKSPNECTEGVTRRGQFEPCDKTAVALRIDPEEGQA